MTKQRAVASAPRAPALLRQQVYLRLREAIEAGTFAPGARLPPSREHARALGVARNTVLWAAERLQAEGYLVARVGDGTYVAERSAPPHNKARVAASPRSSCCRSEAA